MARSSRGASALRALLLLVTMSGAGGLAVWSFVAGRGEAAAEAEREKPVAEPLRVSTKDGRPLVTLDAREQARSGVETAPLAPAPHQEQVRAYGTVLDLARLTDLANSYARTRAQLQGAEAELAAARTAFGRARTLNRDQTVSTAQMQVAQAAFLADQATADMAAVELRTLAATTRQEWGTVLGQALVDGAPALARLIERENLLVQVTLPPGASLPSPPAAAVVEAGGQRIPAAFLSDAARTDPRIQGMSFYYTVPAGSGMLLPGMNVLTDLPAGAATGGAVMPAGAVVWWKDRAWAYRRVSPGGYQRVMVATGLPAPGGGYVVTTLRPGTPVVTQGAQALLSEEFRAQLHVDAD